MNYTKPEETKAYQKILETLQERELLESGEKYKPIKYKRTEIPWSVWSHGTQVTAKYLWLIRENKCEAQWAEMLSTKQVGYGSVTGTNASSSSHGMRLKKDLTARNEELQRTCWDHHEPLTAIEGPGKARNPSPHNPTVKKEKPAPIISLPGQS